MLRPIFFGALAGAFALAGCNCGVPFEETVTIELETDVGGSANCAFDGSETLDGDGNAITTGDFGEVHYNYEHDGAVNPPPVDPTDPNAPTLCTVHVVNWAGALANMEQLITDIRAGVDEQGLNGDTATVTINEVGFANVAIEVVTADGDAFPLDSVGPYNATMNVTDGTSTVNGVIVVNNAGTGPVLEDHITTTTETAALAALLDAAINAGAPLDGTGDADITFVYGDLGTLTNDGDAAPTLRLTAELTVTGDLNVGL